MADTKSCALCRSVAEARLGDAAAVHNRRLLETPQFIVLPSVGPLVVGHVMVVSKAHSASLASMGKDAIDEYESVAVRLKRAPLFRDGDPLEAEHGSTENSRLVPEWVCQLFAAGHGLGCSTSAIGFNGYMVKGVQMERSLGWRSLRAEVYTTTQSPANQAMIGSRITEKRPNHE